MKNLPMKAPRAGGDWETAGSTTPATRRKAPRAGGLGGASGLPAGARRLGVGANNYSPLQERG